MRIFKIFTALSLLICVGCGKKASPEVISVTKSELVAALEKGDIQLLDVRRPEEYDQGHIGDAVNVNVLDSVGFKKGVASLDKEKPIYIYCQAGKRSKKASEKLKAMGFLTIYDYSDGYGSWENEN
ncbi:rhodanese-like domain-containing protein [Flagellimonas sp. S3867]|uniref:rhodanese-like domain-containing protein n=1 Tax=Flagellimonas sp. S3867 TaxID=2768063 RepID=UPI00168330A9|nr:rhodanese-like domain-containing protein [Flagellimonas sp. S3867]